MVILVCQSRSSYNISTLVPTGKTCPQQSTADKGDVPCFTYLNATQHKSKLNDRQPSQTSEWWFPVAPSSAPRPEMPLVLLHSLRAVSKAVLSLLSSLAAMRPCHIILYQQEQQQDQVSTSLRGGSAKSRRSCCCRKRGTNGHVKLGTASETHKLGACLLSCGALILGKPA